MKKTHSGKNRFGNIRFGAILLSVLLTALSFVIAANAETGAQTAYQYEIQALSTSEVFVDGVKLTEDSITETLESIYDSHLRENALSQKECVYAFSSSKEEPEIVVKDSKGREQAVEKRDGRYYALRNWDDEAYTEYKDLAEKTMYAVSKYIVGHETIFGALKYVENKSVAFRYLDLYARGGSEKALYDYTYNDVFIGEFVYLSDDSFACTARSTFNTRYSSKGVIVNKINYLLFFRKGPEGWKAYDIVFRPDRAPDEIDERFKDVASEGIELYPVTGDTYFGYMMIVQDPSRVFVGSSSKGFKTRGLRIDEMIEKYGAIGGINANGFADANGSGDGSAPFGTVIVDGEILREDYQRAGAGFDENNVLHVGKLSGSRLKELGLRDAAGWGPALVIDGEAQKVSDLETGLNPRSAIGQRADGAVLLLFIDGRHANCPGASYTDTIKVMMDFGAVNACNLDGGYSSVMYLNGERISDVLTLEQSRMMPVAFLIRAK